MERKLKTYQLHLTVKGPVFIGDGNEIKKKEYLFLNKNTIGVVDGAKVYSMAKKLHLQKDFENFMIEDTREDLKHWCIRNIWMKIAKIFILKIQKQNKVTEKFQ